MAVAFVPLDSRRAVILELVLLSQAESSKKRVLFSDLPRYSNPSEGKPESDGVKILLWVSFM